jgi:23S rRNA pseudouridine2605 synthase
MRINKYIASAGASSRRGADELIKQGRVKLNGAVITEPGCDVAEGDVVAVDGREIRPAAQTVCYALNKPPGYVTTTSDDKGRATVLDLLTDVTVRVFPVGRLDYETAGLLLLTNDGDLSNHISHPSHKVYKTYSAEVRGDLTLDALRRLREGVPIDGRRTAPAIVELKKQKGNMSLVEIKICEGRNRQVRRMFEAVGCKVTYLQRTAIGEIRLGRLLEGSYRRLTPQEIEYLRGC